MSDCNEKKQAAQPLGPVASFFFGLTNPNLVLSRENPEGQKEQDLRFVDDFIAAVPLGALLLGAGLAGANGVSPQHAALAYFCATASAFAGWNAGALEAKLILRVLGWNLRKRFEAATCSNSPPCAVKEAKLGNRVGGGIVVASAFAGLIAGGGLTISAFSDMEKQERAAAMGEDARGTQEKPPAPACGFDQWKYIPK